MSAAASGAYEDLLRRVFFDGTARSDRTGTGTWSLFGASLRYNLEHGFPVVTTKKVNFHAVATELLWFINGGRNVRWLNERGVHIWDPWADVNGDLGPIYGVQWRSWPTYDGKTIDQLAHVVETLRIDPTSRRAIVSAWNVAELNDMALQPCHVLFQFYASPGRLSCQVYQRSADMFLGVPFNVASYALLTHMVADQLHLVPGDLSWVGGDCHIYRNHARQVMEQLARQPYDSPRLRLRHKPSLFDYAIDDITLDGYRCHPALHAEIAV